ncbi:signal peptidase I [Rossellomorea sp. SC111]|uniref:signal peptidase I SipW n=1 Tax=Rossellomorea sp. SC111 TaxID=2968985 RepID=UPI00215B2F68|nr:signal peptidase I [Rossellomorea sp. SC111]MCR8850478.1 signal peptidase I [Rossellomorea sp. SC111]
MKLKLAKKILSTSITVVLYAVLFIMIFVVVSSKAAGGEPQFFGYQIKTVLSGSMEPGIQTGSIIAVKPGGDMTRFEKGDVITFKEKENILITHRVLEVTKSGDHVMYKTKGDNNDAPDLEPVLSENVVAQYKGFTIPYIGYLMNFMNSKNGALMLIIPGILLLLYSGYTIWKAISTIDLTSKKEDSIEKNIS